ncbi:hypothetical protein [Bradyrhizobium valentinum]|nr:hypothetical protein [Bradyrhizobium valentinum]
MPRKSKKSSPHPDDFMVVSVTLQFQAKPNPNAEDPPPFDFTELQETFLAVDAAEYLEKILAAIRDRRLCGFMTQQAAESPVASGDWIAMTTEDLFASMREEHNKTSRTESNDDS